MPIIPVPATIFLSFVTILLFLLLVGLMFLNKVLCFANCDWPAELLYDNYSKNACDSESDDSDEEIFNNFSTLERSIDRRMSKIKDRRSIADIEKAQLDEISENGFKRSSSTRSSASKKSLKTAILRLMLSMDPNTKNLKVTILQVYDLIRSASQISTTSSSTSHFIYQVHCTMLPEKIKKHKTRPKTGPDPIFNESFTYPNITDENSKIKSLRFRLYLSHNSYTYSIIGQTIINFNTIDLSIESEYNFTMLEAHEDGTTSDDVTSIRDTETASIMSSTDIENNSTDPELMLGLTHNSTTGRLTVEIIRGVNFKTTSSKDFYVKLSLFSTIGKELSHTKTSIRRGSDSPVFRESFIFQVAQFQLNEVSIITSVFAKKSIHRKEMVGWLALGYKSSGSEELDHWNEIKDEAESRQIVRTYKLHQNSNAKQLLNK